MPSILKNVHLCYLDIMSFKPCYKWNTFNTLNYTTGSYMMPSFKPCYKWNTFNTYKTNQKILSFFLLCFKPCYKWNTFNTLVPNGYGVTTGGF